MKDGSIGIQELARIAGVHPSTVSRALNGSSLVRGETAERIRRLAAEHGYIPDDVAKSLSQGKTFTLGILVPEISNSFYAGIVDAIDGAMAPKGYTILLSGTRFDPETEAAAVRTMASKRVDALVVCAPSEEGEGQLTALSRRMPVILCDVYREFGGLDMVLVDEEAGMRQGAEYLLGQGHRSIGCICDRHTERRMAFFRKLLSEKGIPAREHWFSAGAGAGVESGYEGLLSMLDRGELPSAIFAARDNIAVGMLRAAQERGIRVPEDLAILGYDDIRLADFLSRKLTTIRQPAFQIGEKAAELLLRRLENRQEQAAETVRLVPELTVRESA